MSMCLPATKYGNTVRQKFYDLLPSSLNNEAEPHSSILATVPHYIVYITVIVNYLNPATRQANVQN